MQSGINLINLTQKIMSTVNVDIKTLLQKAKAHNAEQLAAAKAQMEEAKSKALIEQLAKHLEYVQNVVDGVVVDLRRARKVAKYREEQLQSVANAQREFEETGDFSEFQKQVEKATSVYREKYYKA
jgi:hypothetical protein